MENEGFIGINALFGGDRWPAGAVVKIPDRAAQAMSVRAFQGEMNGRGPFAEAINRYVQGFVALLMRSAACKRAALRRAALRPVAPDHTITSAETSSR